MAVCRNCKVMIKDDTDRCPLCQQVVETDGTQRDTYPILRDIAKKVRFLENLFLFLSIVTGSTAILSYLKYVIQAVFVIVLLLLVYANVVLRLAIIGKSGYLFKTVSMVLLALVVMEAIDYVCGYRGWAVNYVWPAGVLALDLSIMILMIVNRRNWQSYMMMQLFAIVLALVPVLLILPGMVTFPWLAAIALAVSVFFFLGTLILGDQRARTEMYRRFHI